MRESNLYSKFKEFLPIETNTVEKTNAYFCKHIQAYAHDVLLPAVRCRLQGIRYWSAKSFYNLLNLNFEFVDHLLLFSE